MTTFQAGTNGGNLLTVFLILSPIVTDVASGSAITATYSNGMKSILSGSFDLNGGGGVTGGTLTGWTVYNSDGSLDFSLTGFSVDVQISLSGGNIGNAILTPDITYYGSANPHATDTLFGKGNDTFIGGAATEFFQPGPGTNTIKGGTGHTTVQFTGAIGGYSIVNNGGGSLTVSNSTTTDNISGVQTLEFGSTNYTLGADGRIQAPVGTAAQAIAFGNPGDVAPIGVFDYSSSVVSNLSGLETLYKEGILGTISLDDSNPLSLTPAQLSADAGVLQSIGGTGLIAKIAASAANLTMTGVGNLANIAVFTGPAADYSVAADGSGGVTVTDTLTGRTSTDHLSGFTALQFSDQTVFAAAQPGTGAVTTGNITELYSAALARTPDVSGLAFYQAYLKTNPTTSLTSFAQFFLGSSEYTGNPAHNYAQTSAGETQFVTDLYTNLLHRAPDSGAVPFYLNVINGQLAHDTAGTAQYATDDKSAHAQVLTYISQSTEFLSDVQITAQNPASTQHWLILS